MNMRNTAPAHSACKGTVPQSGVLESQGLHSTDYLLTNILGTAIVNSVQFSSVAQSCPTLCDPMNHSTPGLPVHHTSQMVLVVKNLSANAGDMRWGFNPWIRKILRRRARQPTLVFLPEELHGQRSVEGYRPWSHKQSETTE